MTVSTVLGWLLIHALFVLAGAGFLAAIGLVTATPRSLALALGPAYLVGVAAVVLVLIVLLVIGVPVSLFTIIVVSLLIAGALWAIALRRRANVTALERALPVTSGGERALIWIIGGLIVAYFLFAGTAFTDLPTNWDPAHMWFLKASAIYHYDGLVPELFQNVQTYHFFHMDYPLLQPTFQAAIYHGLGQEAIQWVHVELWGLFAAAVWTAAWLLAPGHRIIVWLPAVAAAAIAFGVPNAPTQGNADLTVGLFVALGGLTLGLWLQRRQNAHLILGALFLAAAANSKKEGQIFAAAIAVGLLVVLVAQRQWRPLRNLVLAGAGALVLIVPWLAYIASNALPSNDTTPVHTLLSNGYLTGRISRLGIAVDGVLGQLQDPNNWMLALPLLLAVGLVSLWVRRLRPLAGYYLIASTLMVCALLWIYWTGTWPDVAQYLNVSVDRTVTSIGLFAALGAGHLAATAALRADEPAPDASGEPAEPASEPALATARS